MLAYAFVGFFLLVCIGTGYWPARRYGRDFVILSHGVCVPIGKGMWDLGYGFILLTRFIGVFRIHSFTGHLNASVTVSQSLLHLSLQGDDGASWSSEEQVNGRSRLKPVDGARVEKRRCSI